MVRTYKPVPDDQRQRFPSNKDHRRHYNKLFQRQYRANGRKTVLKTNLKAARRDLGESKDIFVGHSRSFADGFPAAPPPLDTPRRRGLFFSPTATYHRPLPYPCCVCGGFFLFLREVRVCHSEASENRDMPNIYRHDLSVEQVFDSFFSQNIPTNRQSVPGESLCVFTPGGPEVDFKEIFDSVRGNLEVRRNSSTP